MVTAIKLKANKIDNAQLWNCEAAEATIPFWISARNPFYCQFKFLSYSHTV